MNPKTYNLEQIKNYILSQDSMGDILYNLSEENIEAASVVDKGRD